MSQPPALAFESVDYRPGASALFTELSLEFPRGDCTVIMGPAGAGKSTLLRLGAGLIPPQGGRVLFEGTDWDDHTDDPRVRSALGFAFQNGALWANKSVYQNIELPFVYHRPRADKGEVRGAVARAAQWVGIPHLLPLRPAQLSLGEQKLVSLARSLVLDPEVLFLDDPTGGLDSQSSDRVLELLGDLKRRGRTLILVTQTPTVTARLADRLVVLRSGTVLAEGPFAEVVRRTDPEVVAILTSVLSQVSTFSGDILDLLSIDQGAEDDLK